MEAIDSTGRESKIKKLTGIRRPGLTGRQLIKEYEIWQNSGITYNEVQQERGYNGPQKTAEWMGNMVPETDREGYKILDVGAGTGLVGQQLSEYGFKFIAGLDPSPDLLKVAMDKHVYVNIYPCFMTEKKTVGIESDYYDGLTSCGCFMMNHLQIETLDEMIRVVKSGGHLVITTRLRYLSEVPMYNNNKLDNYMERLEAEGKWKRKSREVFPKYYCEDDGVVWTFMKV